MRKDVTNYEMEYVDRYGNIYNLLVDDNNKEYCFCSYISTSGADRTIKRYKYRDLQQIEREVKSEGYKENRYLRDFVNHGGYAAMKYYRKQYGESSPRFADLKKKEDRLRRERDKPKLNSRKAQYD